MAERFDLRAKARQIATIFERVLQL